MHKQRAGEHTIHIVPVLCVSIYSFYSHIENIVTGGIAGIFFYKYILLWIILTYCGITNKLLL